MVRRQILFPLLAGVVALLHVGVAQAADPRLDEADQAIQKAIALLQAAQNPSNPQQFNGHRKAAVHDLEQARKQIVKAKTFADKPPKDNNKGKGKGKDKGKQGEGKKN